ncbi:MAG: Triosephosphate isomerase [Candidatus Saccharibacteria bacterium]|nr:Triosephosphate isomerase [Candidatus Saccharibacteria bacterium]
MSRDKKIIIGNFKMNLNVHESSLYLHTLAGMVKPRRNVEVVLAPTTLAIQSLSLQVSHRQFKLAAQNFYWRDHGPYTGEVSATMLRGIVKYGLVGHSERRHVFHESDKDIRDKVQAAIRNGIRPVLCIGETAAERADGETQHALHDQLVGGLANVTSDELEQVIIAYEPVWAIGTGQNAVPSDVTAAIQAIRNHISHLYGKPAAEFAQVLYGGSVTASTAADYLALPDVDGLLVGGASLDAHAFTQIIELAHQSGSGEEEL